MDMQQAVASFRFKFFGLIVQTCHNIRKNLGGYSTVQLFLKEPFAYIWYFIQTDIYLLYPLGILRRILILPDADISDNIVFQRSFIHDEIVLIEMNIGSQQLDQFIFLDVVSSA